jgi:hypothetical protein
MKEYRAEQLQENYNKFIEFVKKVFKDNPERLEKLLVMYSANELGEELLLAPASGRLHYHSAYIGGYIDHIMNVCRNAFNIKKMFESGGGRINFTDEELFFAALHHDLGKLGDGTTPYYIPEKSDWHRKNQNSVFKQNPELYWMDVTDRALWLLNQYGIKYSQNEMLAIKLADGLYNEPNKKYFINYSDGGELKTELPYIIHWADHMSCRIESGEYKTWTEKSK